MVEIGKIVIYESMLSYHDAREDVETERLGNARRDEIIKDG